jgi:hypothetical protein
MQALIIEGFALAGTSERGWYVGVDVMVEKFGLVGLMVSESDDFSVIKHVKPYLTADECDRLADLLKKAAAKARTIEGA